jgi:glycosyltransferase involved in cell wall biosynthesis
MALVSCIIPVHNAKVSYLSATLADLRKQSFQDYEIVIVDDASTDEETIQYLRSLEANPKVKLV